MDCDYAAAKNDVLGRWVVGLLLIVLSAGLVGGLWWTLLAGFFAATLTETMVAPREVNEALVMILAGGVGSSVYAIRAYLMHACEKKDFDRAFIPWYFFRTLLGSLLGLMFYFAVRGGILFVTVKAEPQAAVDLNTWSLAAIGALAGLFSKYAIERLRAVFLAAFPPADDAGSGE